MALSASERLGPYEIVEPIGKGGMGEVYRARDTKLRREVAIKVLPEAFTADPGRLARFQREAEVLASLNHPNIAHIYEVEEGALVMELVEGESPKGPMPFDDAWKIGGGIYQDLVMSRDGTRAAAEIRTGGIYDIWALDLATGIGTRITSNGSNTMNPVWSPDGKRIAFSSQRNGHYDLFVNGG